MEYDQVQPKKADFFGAIGTCAARESKFESALIKTAQKGDGASFASLVRPHLRIPYHVALKITFNRQDAEDASQQCLLKAFTRIGQFRGEAKFSTWLTQIAINEALMQARKRRWENSRFASQTGQEMESDPSESVCVAEILQPEVSFLRRENQRMLRVAIAELPNKLRIVMCLVGLQERGVREAAKMLNLSESAIKSRLVRARKKLRDKLTGRLI